MSDDISLFDLEPPLNTARDLMQVGFMAASYLSSPHCDAMQALFKIIEARKLWETLLRAEREKGGKKLTVVGSRR